MSQTNKGLLRYIPGSRSILVQENSNQPLEGFSKNIRESIKEYAESAKSEVEKGHNFLQWILTRVYEATEDDAAIKDAPNIYPAVVEPEAKSQIVPAIQSVAMPQANFKRISLLGSFGLPILLANK